MAHALDQLVDQQLSSWLRGPMFEPLFVQAYFERFFIDDGTITWPNGESGSSSDREIVLVREPAAVSLERPPERTHPESRRVI